MTRAYGSKYAETQSLDLAAVAKLVRADIKAAVKAKKLPADLTYSVRTDRYSMGQSLGILVKGMSDDRQYKVRPTRDEREVLTEEAGRAIERLEAILRAYNYDGSDSMSDYYDVRFSSHVSIQDERGARSAAAEKARKNARKVTSAFTKAGGDLTRDDSGWRLTDADGAGMGRLRKAVVKTPAGGRLHGWWAITPANQMKLCDCADTACAFLIASAA